RGLACRFTWPGYATRASAAAPRKADAPASARITFAADARRRAVAIRVLCGRATPPKYPGRFSKEPKNRIREPRPGLERPGAELEIRQARERDSRLGIDPEKCAAAAEVPVRPRGVPSPGPVRPLLVAQLEAEAPVVRVHPADVGQHAYETRELDIRRLRERLRRDEARALQLRREAQQVVERAVHLRAGRPAQLRAQAQRLEHRRGEVLLERHLRRLGDGLRKHVEADVR